VCSNTRAKEDHGQSRKLRYRLWEYLSENEMGKIGEEGIFLAGTRHPFVPNPRRRK
jgi:hypothetical protein